MPRLGTQSLSRRGGGSDLIWNIHGVAKAAELDGDEVGNLVGRVAEIKRVR